MNENISLILYIHRTDLIKWIFSDYIDQTSVTCHFIHSNNLSTFLSSVDNNVDGCLIFDMQEGGNAASGPLPPSSCAAADLAGCPQPLSLTVTTKQPSRLISFKRYSGQVNVRAFKTAQTAREMHTGAPPHTQTPLICPLQPYSTRQYCGRCLLYSKKISKLLFDLFFLKETAWRGRVIGAGFSICSFY